MLNGAPVEFRFDRSKARNQTSRSFGKGQYMRTILILVVGIFQFCGISAQAQSPPPPTNDAAPNDKAAQVLQSAYLHEINAQCGGLTVEGRAYLYTLFSEHTSATAVKEAISAAAAKVAAEGCTDIRSKAGSIFDDLNQSGDSALMNLSFLPDACWDQPEILRARAAAAVERRIPASRRAEEVSKMRQNVRSQIAPYMDPLDDKVCSYELRQKASGILNVDRAYEVMAEIDNAFVVDARRIGSWIAVRGLGTSDYNVQSESIRTGARSTIVLKSRGTGPLEFHITSRASEPKTKAVVAEVVGYESIKDSFATTTIFDIDPTSDLRFVRSGPGTWILSLEQTRILLATDKPYELSIERTDGFVDRRERMYAAPKPSQRAGLFQDNSLTEAYRWANAPTR